MFCPHDGAKLTPQQAPPDLVGDTLHHLFELKSFLYRDSFGERYTGVMTGSGHPIKATIFNQEFVPPADRIPALASTKALIDTPTPPQISSCYSWEFETSPAYLLETQPDGPSLRRLLDDRGALDWRLAIKIVCSIARIMAWLDDLGVVHRSLAPRTIYVTDPARGYVHVSEWALGVLAYRPEPLKAHQEGAQVFAPSYMSPEAIENERGADRRSMIYTLGVLLYEMLVGNAPFGGPTAEETLRRHLEASTVQLSNAYEGDERLPPALNDLFEVFTQRDPEQRFQTLPAVVNALSSMLDDGTTAEDLPVPVRAESEPNVFEGANGHSPSTSDPSKESSTSTNKKETLLYIPSQDRDEDAARTDAAVSGGGTSTTPADAAARPSVEAKQSSISSVEVDDAVNKPTVQMDKSVLAEDEARAAEAQDEAASTRKEAVAPPPADVASSSIEVDPSLYDDDGNAPADESDSNGVTVNDPSSTGRFDSVKAKDKNPADESSSASDVDDAEDTSTVVISKDFADESKAREAQKASAPKDPDRTSADASSASIVIDEAFANEADQERADTSKAKDPSRNDDAAADKAAKDTSTKTAEPDTKGASKKTAAKKKTRDESASASRTSEVAAADASAELRAGDKTSQFDAADLDDQWFSADTEGTWDQEVLREHAKRTDERTRTMLYVALGIFFGAVLLFFGYLIFIYEDPDEAEEQSARDDAALTYIAQHQHTLDPAHG